MRKIRGIKVEPDAASNDAGEQTNNSCSGSSNFEQPTIKPPSDSNQPHVANTAVLKKHNKKAIVTDDTVTEVSSTVNSSVDASADQQSNKQPVPNVNLGEDIGPTTVTETGSVASSSSNKQTSSDSLRTCAHCHKQETTLHEFKKCKK